ncbi:hypothetical protein CK203_035460 [Vitis vinifera]|uniref:Retrotransposon gag domain-containing protein n=1 Tax=Vitis vinifera TaxID=29760 RepID=A0A438I3N6_VITVI|nr:hypothetical protein CK203_035460 [Vitis vinifera]
MRARLRPQEPGKERPLVAATWEAYPDPPVASTVQNNPCTKRSRIIHYDPPRGFLVPKFSAYDGSSDPFDHIMHYRQLMTLDIGNDVLLCKVFPASLQDQALLWFHQLPSNSIDNFGTYRKLFGTIPMLRPA